MASGSGEKTSAVEEFRKTFLPSRRIMEFTDEIVYSPALTDPDWKGAIGIDPEFAKLALRAKAAGIVWISGGVEFIANHEEAHWILRKRAGGAEGSGSVCSEENANGYAFERSNNKIEDYSSTLAICTVLFFYNPQNPNHRVHLKSIEMYGKEKMFKMEVKSQMDYHGVEKQLSQNELDKVKEKSWEKFLELEPLMRES